MAATLEADPLKPPPLDEVTLPEGECVASALLAATDALSIAAAPLLPRLKPDPDHRRPPLSLTDAQSISQSRADERRKQQARREKAGKASAKAFAAAAAAGGASNAPGLGGPSVPGTHPGHHPHHKDELPGSLPEGESEKSAYWTFVQAYFRELPAEDLADLLPAEGITKRAEEGAAGGDDDDDASAAVAALAARDSAFRLPAPSGELAPLGAPLTDRGPPRGGTFFSSSSAGPASAFAAPVLPPGGTVIDVVPRPSPSGKGGGSRPASAATSPTVAAAPVSASAPIAAAPSATAATPAVSPQPPSTALPPAAAPAPAPLPQQQQQLPFFPRNRSFGGGAAAGVAGGVALSAAARRERAAASLDPDFYLLSGVVFDAAPASEDAADPDAAAAAAPVAVPRFLGSLIEGCDASDLAAAAAFVARLSSFDDDDGGGDDDNRAGERAAGKAAEELEAAGAPREAARAWSRLSGAAAATTTTADAAAPSSSLLPSPDAAGAEALRRWLSSKADPLLKAAGAEVEPVSLPPVPEKVRRLLLSAADAPASAASPRRGLAPPSGSVLSLPRGCDSYRSWLAAVLSAPREAGSLPDGATVHAHTTAAVGSKEIRVPRHALEAPPLPAEKEKPGAAAASGAAGAAKAAAKGAKVSFKGGAATNGAAPPLPSADAAQPSKRAASASVDYLALSGRKGGAAGSGPATPRAGAALGAADPAAATAANGGPAAGGAAAAQQHPPPPLSAAAAAVRECIERGEDDAPVDPASDDDSAAGDDGRCPSRSSPRSRSLEKAWRTVAEAAREGLLAAAPSDEIEAELLALQAELASAAAASRARVATALRRHASSLDAERRLSERNKVRGASFARLFLARAREQRRAAKRAAREAAVKDAALAAEAALAGSKRGGGGGFFLRAGSASGDEGAQRPPSEAPRPVDRLATRAGDEDAMCAVCADGVSAHPNLIVFCERCDVAVHQGCYGLSALPEGEWLCWPCREHEERALASGVPRSAVRPPRWQQKTGGAVSGAGGSSVGAFAAAATRGAPGSATDPSASTNTPLPAPPPPPRPGGAPDVSCALCPVRRGAFRRTVDGSKWVHSVCALWQPEASLRAGSGCAVVGGVAACLSCDRRGARCAVCGLDEGVLVRCGGAAGTKKRSKKKKKGALASSDDDDDLTSDGDDDDDDDGPCRIMFHPLCGRNAGWHLSVAFAVPDASADDAAAAAAFAAGKGARGAKRGGAKRGGLGAGGKKGGAAGKKKGGVDKARGGARGKASASAAAASAAAAARAAASALRGRSYRAFCSLHSEAAAAEDAAALASALAATAPPPPLAVGPASTAAAKATGGAAALPSSLPSGAPSAYDGGLFAGGGLLAAPPDPTASASAGGAFSPVGFGASGKPQKRDKPPKPPRVTKKALKEAERAAAAVAAAAAGAGRSATGGKTIPGMFGAFAAAPPVASPAPPGQRPLPLDPLDASFVAGGGGIDLSFAEGFAVPRSAAAALAPQAPPPPPPREPTPPPPGPPSYADPRLAPAVEAMRPREEERAALGAVRLELETLRLIIDLAKRRERAKAALARARFASLECRARNAEHGGTQQAAALDARRALKRAGLPAPSSGAWWAATVGGGGGSAPAAVGGGELDAAAASDASGKRSSVAGGAEGRAKRARARHLGGLSDDGGVGAATALPPGSAPAGLPSAPPPGVPAAAPGLAPAAAPASAPAEAATGDAPPAPPAAAPTTEAVMTPGQARAANEKLPEGFVYIPVQVLSEEEDARAAAEQRRRQQQEQQQQQP